MPAALPLSGGLHFLALETGRHGRLSDGHRTRCLLPRVLLDPNGTALLRRGDELVADRRSTLFVLLEKVMPFGAIGGRAIGGIVGSGA